VRAPEATEKKNKGATAVLVLGGVVAVAVLAGVFISSPVLTPLPEPQHEYVAAVCRSCGAESRVCAAAMGVEYALPPTCSPFVDAIGSESCDMYWGPNDAASHDDYDLVALLYYTCSNKGADAQTISDSRRLMELYSPNSADLYVSMRRTVERDFAGGE